MSIGIVGQGGVVSFSTTSAIGRVRTIQLPEWLAPRVDFTSLDEIDWMIFLPGSPTDPGQAVLDVYFDTTIALPPFRTIETMTYTFPIMVAGNATAATLVGSGFFTGEGFGNAASAQPHMRGLTFAFDGNSSKPAFSIETT